MASWIHNAYLHLSMSLINFVAAIRCCLFFLAVLALSSCSTRDGVDAVAIKEGKGEVLLQLGRCGGGYNLCLEPIDFDVEKSSETVYVVSVEVENRSAYVVGMTWGGPVISKNPYIRDTGTRDLAMGKSKTVSFIDIPQRGGAGKAEFLSICGYENPINVIIRIRFTKPVNGSLKIFHVASTI